MLFNNKVIKAPFDEKSNLWNQFLEKLSIHQEAIKSIEYLRIRIKKFMATS